MKKLNSKCIIFIFLSFIFNSTTYAFLENVTHGYPNCMTCHYAPSGGDLLNDYGRSLSAELMSTFQIKEGFEKPFANLVKENKWLKLGGDIRTLQRYLDNPQVRDSALFLMQSNVEVGLKYKKIMFIGTAGIVGGPEGYIGGPNDSLVKDEFISERHYLLADVDQTSRIRVGKFRVNYGINDPNHNRPIKSALGFGSNSEVYNIEYSKFFENSDFLINYSLGRIDLSRPVNDERSMSSQANYYFQGKSKIGLGALYGESPDSNRLLLGSFGITSLTEKSYLIYEVDYESEKVSLESSRTGQWLSHLRLGYEVLKGLRAYAIYDFRQTESQSDSRMVAPGLGFQWLPMPHIELQMEYQAMRFKSQAVTHFGFFLFHVYL